MVHDASAPLIAAQGTACYPCGMSDAPAPDDLRQMLVATLSGATGKPEPHWDNRVGELVRVVASVSPRTNWALALKRGSADDRRAVDEAERLARIEHPYVRW
jgi:hypothetical protein